MQIFVIRLEIMIIWLFFNALNTWEMIKENEFYVWFEFQNKIFLFCFKIIKFISKYIYVFKRVLRKEMNRKSFLLLLLMIIAFKLQLKEVIEIIIKSSNNLFATFGANTLRPFHSQKIFLWKNTKKSFIRLKESRKPRKSRNYCINTGLKKYFSYSIKVCKGIV